MEPIRFPNELGLARFCVIRHCCPMKSPLQEAGSGKKKARTDKRAG